MQEILYIEVPKIETQQVIDWLKNSFQAVGASKKITSKGIILEIDQDSQLSIFVWSLQRTTYLKVFRYGEKVSKYENSIIKNLFEQVNKSNIIK